MTFHLKDNLQRNMLLMGLLKLRLVSFKNTPALFYLFGTIGAVAMSVSTASSSIAAIATHTVAVGAVSNSSQLTIILFNTLVYVGWPCVYAKHDSGEC